MDYYQTHEPLGKPKDEPIDENQIQEASLKNNTNIQFHDSGYQNNSFSYENLVGYQPTAAANCVQAMDSVLNFQSPALNSTTVPGNAWNPQIHQENEPLPDIYQMSEFPQIQIPEIQHQQNIYAMENSAHFYEPHVNLMNTMENQLVLQSHPHILQPPIIESKNLLPLIPQIKNDTSKRKRGTPIDPEKIKHMANSRKRERNKKLNDVFADLGLIVFSPESYFRDGAELLIQQNFSKDATNLNVSKDSLTYLSSGSDSNFQELSNLSNNQNHVCSLTYHFAEEIKYDQYGHRSFGSSGQKKKHFEISMNAQYHDPRIADMRMKDKIREARTPLWMRKILSISFFFLHGIH